MEGEEEQHPGHQGGRGHHQVITVNTCVCVWGGKSWWSYDSGCGTISRTIQCTAVV